MSSFKTKMLEIYEKAAKREEFHTLPSSIAIDNIIESLNRSYQDEDIGGISSDSWINYIDYRGICLDAVSKALGNSPESETYNCKFVDLILGDLTNERYILTVNPSQNGTFISCDVNFRTSVPVIDDLEDGKDLQCLRVAYDLIYQPCKDLMGDIMSVSIPPYTVPLETLPDLLDPHKTIEDRIAAYKSHKIQE